MRMFLSVAQSYLVNPVADTPYKLSSNTLKAQTYDYWNENISGFDQRLKNKNIHNFVLTTV